MGRAIGIDLGTTNTVMAIKTGDVRTLINKENEDLTPSVVCEYKKQIRVGRLAVDQRVQAPKDTIVSIKRLMGRAFRDENVKKVRETYPYEVVEPSDGTDEDLRVMMGGKQYSPIQISAEILKKIKADAEERLNESVEFAVITVPAYFTEKQKDATRKAGQLAGFKVQKILDEPTAAALAFGLDNFGEEPRTILVFDLGGGTFDVSVMTIAGGLFAQLDIEGDMWLGGDDFDRKVMDHVLHHVSITYGVDGKKDARFMVKLKTEAERAKISLSSLDRTEIIIPGALQDEEKNLIDIELDFSRAEFEKMISPDVDRSIELVNQAIRNAGEAMTADQIDHVLLVGGSSCIPMVRKRLAEVFGQKKLLMNIEAMKCVASGAAILACKWAEQIECSKGHVNPGKNLECETCGEPLTGENLAGPGGAGKGSPQLVLGGVTAQNYGIETEGGAFDIIIPKNFPYPMELPETGRFKTTAPNLRRIRVPICVGFENRAAENELQATIWLELPENVPENTPVDVSFSLDHDGILRKVVVALLDGSGVQVDSYLERGDTERARLEKKLEQLRNQKEKAKDNLSGTDLALWEHAYGQATRALNQGDNQGAAGRAKEMEKLLQATDPDWKIKAENLCGYSEWALDYSWLMDPPKIQELKTLVRDLHSALERNDEAATRATFAKLDKATDDLPPPVYVCINLGRAVSAAQYQGLLGEADQLKAARSEIESLLRAGNFDKAFEALDKIAPLMKKVNAQGNQGENGPKTEGGLRR